MKKRQLFLALERERQANNGPWITLIELAFEHDPERAAICAEQIIDRDHKIDEALWKIVEAYRGHNNG